jgi:hypothetical protein
MRNAGTAALLVVVVLLGACGGNPATNAPAGSPAPGASSMPAGSSTPTDTSGPASSGDGQSAWEALLAAPANPITVSIKTDDGAAAAQVLSSDGGTLTASGADGTKYELTIPVGALSAPTPIRMTPLTAVEGMPFGTGAPLGVVLEPDGLRLADVATLTITPTAPMPADQQIFFGFQGAAHELGFAAPVVDSSALEIMVTHFSGYGVQKGLLADTEPVRERLGGDVERRLSEIVADELGRLRQKALLGVAGPADDAALKALFAWVDKVWREQVLTPRLEAAGESCAAGRLALMTVLAYERQRQLLGLGAGEAVPGLDAGLIDTVAGVCLQEEYELCRDQHIIHRIIPVVLSLMRQSALLGFDDTGALEAKGDDMVRKCLTFELDLSVGVVVNPPQGWAFQSDMTSKVRLEAPTVGELLNQAINHQGDGISGQAPLVNTRFVAKSKIPFCKVTSSSRGGSTLHVSQLAWDVAFRDEQDELGYVKDVSMIIDPEPTTESYRGACGPSAVNGDNANVWSGTYGTIQAQACQQDAGQGAGGAGASAAPGSGGSPQFGLGACQTERGWDVTAGETFATKKVDLSYKPGSMTEKGTLALKHTPA